jgi:hypothetical protein
MTRPVTDEPGRKAVEAHAYCANIVCLNLREKTVALRGFNSTLDGEPLGLCGKCYTRIQMAFIEGTAAIEVALMLGAEPDRGGRGDPDDL